MAKKVVGSLVTGPVTFSLRDEEMGFLERTGLAGLRLTLDAIPVWASLGDQRAGELREQLHVEYQPDAVTLSWEGDGKVLLTDVVRWAWQVRDKVFFLPGIHRTKDVAENLWLRLDVHNGLVQTFFQHNRVLAKDPISSAAITVDEDKFFLASYRGVSDSKKAGEKRALNELPQHKAVTDIIKSGFEEDVLAEAPSWLYPGSAMRYQSDTKWCGSPKTAFLLLFAPIAAIYFELPRSRVRLKGSIKPTPNWAIVIPDVQDLDLYSKAFLAMRSRTQNDFLRVKVQSVSDAGLRFSASYATSPLGRRLGLECVHVVAIGKVNHYANQSVRKKVVELRPSATAIDRYCFLMRELPNRFVPGGAVPQEGTEGVGQATVWIAQPSARGLVADNLVSSAPWYRGMLTPPEAQFDELETQRSRYSENISIERLWLRNLLRWDSREGLMNLANEERMWDRPEEATLFSIFREGLRRLLNKEQNKALVRGGSRKLGERWEDRVESIHRELLRAKTLELTRKFVVEFLANAGGEKTLTEHRTAVWRMINDKQDWKKVRDLAMLALVTFTDKRLGTNQTDAGAPNDQNVAPERA